MTQSLDLFPIEAGVFSRIGASLDNFPKNDDLFRIREEDFIENCFLVIFQSDTSQSCVG